MELGVSSFFEFLSSFFPKRRQTATPKKASRPGETANLRHFSGSGLGFRAWGFATSSCLHSLNPKPLESGPNHLSTKRFAVNQGFPYSGLCVGP